MTVFDERGVEKGIIGWRSPESADIIKKSSSISFLYLFPSYIVIFVVR